MTVTDRQVAAMRAGLSGDIETHEHMLAELSDTNRNGYNALVTAAFLEAVDRRFGENPRRSDVIKFVADLRSRSDGIRDSLPVDAAEQMIFHASTGEGTLDGLDQDVVFGGQIIIAAGLIGDEQLAPAGLDAFLAEARRTADGILARRGM